MDVALTEPKIRRCFFGCNSADGFHSYFDFLHELDDARISIVKGGPGTGKSNFIREIGDTMLEHGFNIEYQHCSLDPESFDAVVVPDIRVVVVAATGHHVFDPQAPGAIDEILNLGIYWNEDGIRPHCKQIMDINVASGRTFHKAYRYLKAARLILDNVETLCAEAVSKPKINQVVVKIADSLFADCGVAETLAHERNLFVSSITPFGTVSHVDTLINPGTTILGLVGEYGSGRSEVIRRIAELARLKGVQVEVCHNPLDLERLEHLFLPKLNVLLTTEPLKFLEQNPWLFDLNECLAPWFQEYAQEVSEEKEKFQELIDDAIKTLRTAKKTHEKLEQYYIPNMDFVGVDNYRQNTVEKILRHAERFGMDVGQ